MERLDWIEGEGFEALRGQRAALVDGPVYTLLDPTEYAVAVGEGDRARLVIVHTKPESATLSIDVGENAKLSIVEMFIDEAFVECSIRQQGGSLCEVTMAELTSANVSYRIDLDGAFARSELDGLFLAADKEHCEVGVRVSHNVPDCSSRSLVKGVAGGEATGAFQGLVYVAPGAQRTDAQQTSRNVGLLQPPGQNSGSSAQEDSIPSLEVGKYVMDNVYVGLEQGMNGDASGVRVEIELAPNLNLEGVSTPQGSEVGLNWKKDY